MLVENLLPNIIIGLIILCMAIFIGLLVYRKLQSTNIQDSTSDFKLETNYKNQVKLLSDTYNPFLSIKSK